MARIISCVPVKFHEEDFELNTPDFEKVKAIFHDLEFRQLTENLVKTFRLEGVQIEVGKKNTPEINKQVSDNAQFDLFSTPSTQSTNTTNQSGYQTIESKSHFYQYVSSPIARKLLIKKLCSQKSVCFDTETTHIKSLEASLVGIAFSWESKKGYYVPFTQNKDEAQKMLEEFRPFFESESIEKIGQNLKYDIKVLSNYGMQVKGPLFDTMIAHYLINPDMRHNMDILAETYLNYSPISIESLIGKKGKNQLSMQQVPLEKQTEYAVEDADITLQLKQYFKPILEETGTQKLFNEIEIPLVSVLADMENEGIRLDVNFLKSMSIDMAKEIALFEEKIFTEAGETFNLASPKQLGDILFDKLKIGGPKPKKTKTGQYATGEEVLGYLAKDHEIIQNILEWRQLVKLQSTYVEALPSQVDKNTLRVHTDYMQTVAATGRLSSNNPNLQNIPIRTERGRQIRKAFIARNEDYILLAADYSQIELRIIAALSGEENMIKAFQNNEDIHRSTAAKVFNVPLAEVTKEQRSNAKTVNFGIIYGVSAFGLSNQTNLNRSESAALIEAYYQTYPRLKAYIHEQIEFARSNGFVETISGRRRYLKDINSANAVVRGAAERNAVNAPIQGSAADIIKIAMINIHRKLKEGKFKTKMLLQVHDELVFDAYKEELDAVEKLIKSEMEQAFVLSVPLVVDMGKGRNWLEAH